MPHQEAGHYCLPLCVYLFYHGHQSRGCATHHHHHHHHHHYISIFNLIKASRMSKWLSNFISHILDIIGMLVKGLIGASFHNHQSASYQQHTHSFCRKTRQFKKKKFDAFLPEEPTSTHILYKLQPGESSNKGVAEGKAEFLPTYVRSITGNNLLGHSSSLKKGDKLGSL